MLKKDGHTHTQFCPHGNGDPAEKMIQKAISLGFQEYSLTEHAPLPPNFKADYEGTDSGLYEAAMAEKDLAAYFQMAHALQLKYSDHLKINVGFELDYLPSQLNWTRSFWQEYGPQTTDNILSVHFLQGKNNKFWCVDNTPEEFKEGLLDDVRGDGQVLYGRYLDALMTAMKTDFGPNGPKRLGHMTLIKKFQDRFNLPSRFNQANMTKVQTLLNQVKTMGWSLDLNTAGLYKADCNEIYPYPEIAQLAFEMAIPLVYGSDAHSIGAIGGGYHEVEQFLN